MVVLKYLVNDLCERQRSLV